MLSSCSSIFLFLLCQHSGISLQDIHQAVLRFISHSQPVMYSPDFKWLPVEVVQHFSDASWGSACAVIEVLHAFEPALALVLPQLCKWLLTVGVHVLYQ